MRISDWSSDVCSSDLGHVRRVAAAGHGAADGLGDGADVVRGGAAAEPDVAHVELQAGACEVRAFVAVAGEGIERGRERAIPGNTGAGRIGQGDRKSTRLNSSH